MLMRAAIVVQQLCKSCRTCFKFYCIFYFTCDRSLRAGAIAGVSQHDVLPSCYNSRSCRSAEFCCKQLGNHALMALALLTVTVISFN